MNHVVWGGLEDVFSSFSNHYVPLRTVPFQNGCPAWGADWKFGGEKFTWLEGVGVETRGSCSL